MVWAWMRATCKILYFKHGINVREFRIILDVSGVFEQPRVKVEHPGRGSPLGFYPHVFFILVIPLHGFIQIVVCMKIVIGPGQDHNLSKGGHVHVQVAQNVLHVVHIDRVVFQRQVPQNTRHSVHKHVHIVAETRPRPVAFDVLDAETVGFARGVYDFDVILPQNGLDTLDVFLVHLQKLLFQARHLDRHFLGNVDPRLHLVDDFPILGLGFLFPQSALLQELLLFLGRFAVEDEYRSNLVPEHRGDHMVHLLVQLVFAQKHINVDIGIDHDGFTAQVLQRGAVNRRLLALFQEETVQKFDTHD